MMQKKYANEADRQRAHRQRTKERLAGLQQLVAPQKTTRKLTRPQRLARAVAEISTLKHEYEGWLQALPTNLEESALAEQLNEAIDQLQVVLDATEEVILPRGFGR
jgi:hypothetical protein